MTKTELMETYTAEQLAEMEKLYRDITQCKEHSGEHLHSEEYLKILNLNRTISELQSEVEKYRKAFEYAKKERDCQISEHRKKIDELTDENKKYIEQIMSSIPLLHGYSVSEVARAIFEHCNAEAVRMSNKNRFDYREEAEKIAKDGCETYILCLIKCLQGLCAGENYTEENVLAKLIPTEPIKVADMLINAEGEYERNPLAKVLCGEDKGTYRIFDVPELRQVAEHLLVYCNHNGEVEE